MKKQFKPGDRVQLKSGGPSMTVKELIPPNKHMGGQYLCQWFNRENLKQGFFAQDSIQEVKELPEFDI